MAGINLDGRMVSSLYESFNRIAQDDAVGNNTVLRLADSGDREAPVVTTGGDFIGNVGRFKETQNRNNAVRTAFLEMVKGKLGARTVADLPPTVQTALELNNFNVDENGQATTGRPLSARRIRAVLSAMEKEMLELELEEQKKTLKTVLQKLAHANFIPFIRVAETHTEAINWLSGHIAEYLKAIIEKQGASSDKTAKEETLRKAVNNLLGSVGSTDSSESKLSPRQKNLGLTACLLAVAKARARVRVEVLKDPNARLFAADAKIFDEKLAYDYSEDDPEFMEVARICSSRMRRACDSFIASGNADSTIEDILDDLQKTIEQGVPMKKDVAMEQEEQVKDAAEVEKQKEVKRCKEKITFLFYSLEALISSDSASLMERTGELVLAFRDFLKVSTSRDGEVDESAQRLGLELVRKIVDAPDHHLKNPKAVALTLAALCHAKDVFSQEFESGQELISKGQLGIFAESFFRKDGDGRKIYDDFECFEVAWTQMKKFQAMDLNDPAQIKAFFSGDICRETKAVVDRLEKLIFARGELQKAERCDLFDKMVELQSRLKENLKAFIQDLRAGDSVLRPVSLFRTEEARKVFAFVRNNPTSEITSLKCTAWLLALQVTLQEVEAEQRGETFNVLDELKKATAGGFGQGRANPTQAYHIAVTKLMDVFQKLYTSNNGKAMTDAVQELDINDGNALTDDVQNPDINDGNVLSAFLDRLPKQLQEASTARQASRPVRRRGGGV